MKPTTLEVPTVAAEPSMHTVAYVPTPIIAVTSVVPKPTTTPGPVPSAQVSDVTPEFNATATPTATATPGPSSSPDISEGEPLVIINTDGQGSGPIGTEPPPSGQEASSGTWWLWLLLALTAMVPIYIIWRRRKRARYAAIRNVEPVEENVIEADDVDVGDILVIDRMGIQGYTR